MSVKEYVENLNKKYGMNWWGVHCLVYNATRDYVTFDVAHDYMGYIRQTPYQVIIANGQQGGGFFHVKKPGDSEGSKADVVYRGKNNAGDACTHLESGKQRHIQLLDIPSIWSAFCLPWTFSAEGASPSDISPPEFILRCLAGIHRDPEGGYYHDDMTLVFGGSRVIQWQNQKAQ